MDDLLGRVAVITGSGSGIGRATALALAREGTRVVVTDRIADRVDSVVGEIRALDMDAVGLSVDVADDAAMVSLRDAALERWGRVDIVMNNTGIITIGRPESIPVDEWRHAIDVNLLSFVRSLQVFLPLFIEQGSGHVVNTASTAGLFGYAYERLPYSATKSAVVGMSEALALYLRPQGIGVTCLCPGPVATNIAGDIHFHDEVPINSPDLDVIDADAVGSMVIDAIKQNRFLLLTHPAVHDMLVRRAEDPEQFLADQIARMAPITPPGP